MSDDNEPTSEAPSEPKPAEVVHHGMTEEQVDAKMRKLRDELAELHAGDKAEREELKAELAELREYKEQQEKAQSERDKVKGSDSTMVLPPSDIPPQQPAPPPSNPPNEHGEEGAKRSRWKRAW